MKLFLASLLILHVASPHAIEDLTMSTASFAAVEQLDSGATCFAGLCSDQSFLGPGSLCLRDRSCMSGRCEFACGFCPVKFCEEQLGLEERCNEDTDCLSFNCDDYRCAAPDLCSEASGFGFNSLLDQLIDRAFPASEESLALLRQLDPFTVFASAAFPGNLIGATTGSDRDVFTSNITVGWEKTGDGFDDWEQDVDTPETVRLTREDFQIVTLDVDDFRGPISAFDEILTQSLQNGLAFSDATVYADSLDQADQLAEDLMYLPEGEGSALRPSYNTDFDMISDESFSRVMFHSLGAPVLAAQKETSNSEYGPFEVDLDLSHLPMRERFRPLGVRVHLDEDQRATAIFDYAEGTLFKPGDAGWEAAKFLARSTVLTAITVREHLMWTHLMLSNSATRVSQLAMQPSHPIRRLLAIFTYGSTTVNSAATIQLVPEFSVLHRVSGFAYESMEELFDWSFETSNIYEPFPSRTTNQALLDLAEDGKFPYLTEGIEYYHIVEEFVKEWCEQAGDAVGETNAQAMAFYGMMRQDSLGQAYEIPEFSGEAHDMVDLLTQIIFTVTGWHELVGNIIDYTIAPERSAFRVSNCDPEQTDVQSFLIGLALTGQTNLRAPALVADYENFFGAGGAPSYERTVWNSFQQKLKDQSLKVNAADAVRAVQYRYFDPARFESSISV